MSLVLNNRALFLISCSSFTHHSFLSLTGVDMRLQRLSMTPLSAPLLSKSIGENISSPNRVAITPNHYGSIVVGFPDLVSMIYLHYYCSNFI